MTGKEESEKLDHSNALTDRFAVKARLNLNDLLQKRKEEKQVDKKTNLIIVSSVSVLAVVVFVILSL